MKIKTLLIVDDEPEIRNFIRYVAEKNGWQVQECGRGDQIIAALEATPSISLMLLDIHMPRMDGIEAIAQLIESGIKNLPIYVMTGGAPLNADSAQKIAAMNGIDVRGQLLKPLTVDALASIFAAELKLP